MYPKFVKTSNVERFLAAASSIEDTGAPEACMMLCSGEPGFGKSAAGQWWATHNEAAFVRIKAATTPHWVLSDLITELGQQPQHTCERMFLQAVTILVKEPRPLVFDEIENAIHRDITAIETIRDISDLVEVPVVLLGREFCEQKLKRHRQIWSRISAHAAFAPATEKDVKLCVDELCEVEVAPEVIGEVLRQSEGRLRDVIKCLKSIERIGLRQKGQAVTVEDIAGRPLTPASPRRSANRKAA